MARRRNGERERVQRDVAVISLAGVTAGIASIDVLLLKRGHSSLSNTIRSRIVLKVLATALWLHLIMKLPFDPLTWIGSKLVPVKTVTEV